MFEETWTGNIPVAQQSIAIEQYMKDWSEIICTDDYEKIKYTFHSMTDENKLEFYDKAIFIKQLLMCDVDYKKSEKIYSCCKRKNIKDVPDVFSNEDAEQWLLINDETYMSAIKFTGD